MLTNTVKNSVLKHSKHLALLLVMFASLTAGSTATAQEYTEVRRLGTHQAICKPGIHTAEELQAFFANSPETVEAILNHANWKGNSKDLFAAIANGNFVEKKYTAGQTFQWMSAKRGGEAVSLPNRIWAGKYDFEGFEVNLVSQCVNYQMVIPKECCNLSLATTTEIKTEPTLTTTVEGDAITVCSVPGTTVTMTEPNAAQRELPLDANGCWTGAALAAGNYSFTAADECGVTTESATIAAPVIAAPIAKKSGIIPFIAPFIGTETLMRFETRWEMDMRDSSGLVGLRAGAKFPLAKSLYLVPAVGIFSRTSVNEGIDFPDEGVSIDLGLEKYVSKSLFIGAGVGIWNVDDSDFDQESFFINAGGDISKAMEWFVEARGIDSDNVDGKDGFSDNHAYNAGVRFKF